MRSGAVIVLGLGLSLGAGMARAEPGAPELPRGLVPGMPVPFEFGPDWRPYPPGPLPPRLNSKQRDIGPSSRAPANSPDAAKREADLARAERLKKALAPRRPPAEIRRQRLDALFERLRSAPDPGAAKAIAASIEQAWLETHSDTARLLLERAFAAVSEKHYPLALSVLDKIVALEPDWAEAWNRRATTRFMAGDLDGAMADIDRVLKLEPRHFGALSGMGVILRQVGRDRQALQVFNEALAVYPLQPELQALVERLRIEIEGRSI